MSANDGEVVRRPNVSKKPVTRADYGGDSTRVKDRRRRRYLREEHNRRVALICVASFLFFATVLFLHIRPRRKHKGIDTLRYEHAKELRDAALSGGKLGKGRHRGEKHVLNNPLNVGGMRYLDPRQLAPLPGEPNEPYNTKRRKANGFRGLGDDEWQSETELPKYRNLGPKVDYTKHTYEYPELIFEPLNDGSYPPLQKMSTIFETWGQDDLDTPPETLVEVLQHFDYQDPEQLKVRGCLINITKTKSRRYSFQLG